jgi:PASTA domain
MREYTRWAVTGVLVVVLAGATGAAFASQGFADPQGDAEPAPDIERMTVDVDPATARLRFLISTPNRAQLATNEAIFVYVDLDPDRSPAFDRLEYELIISPTWICRRPPIPVCSPSSGFAYENADSRVSMTFKPERAVPIDFKVVTVHVVDGRSYGDSAPNRGTSKRARHYRIERTMFAEACVAPNVRGMRLVVARRAIARARCAVGHVTRVGSRTEAGRVLRQVPPPSSLLPRGGRVDLVVSSRRR